MNLADMVIDLFTAESTLLRTEMMIALKGEEASQLQILMTKTYFVRCVRAHPYVWKTRLMRFCRR